MDSTAASAEEAPMLRIAIIVGSTRPGRIGAAVGAWAYDIARARDDAHYELLDVADFNLPVLDEGPPAMSLEKSPALADQYRRDHTRRWSSAIASFDGYVFVTPEYNHGIGGALKNAIDFLYHEWSDKAAGFVGYGYTMGARAIESLRLVMAALQVATVRPQVGLSLFTDFQDFTQFTPAELHQRSLGTMLDHLIAWSGAMRSVREPNAQLVAAAGGEPDPDDGSNQRS
jgi:NAD(P)H-dependent FMN reductase